MDDNEIIAFEMELELYELTQQKIRNSPSDYNSYESYLFECIIQRREQSHTYRQPLAQTTRRRQWQMQ